MQRTKGNRARYQKQMKYELTQLKGKKSKITIVIKITSEQVPKIVILKFIKVA